MLSRVSRAVPGLLDETHAMLMRCDGALFAEQQAAAAGRPDYRASLAAVSAPTLTLAGEEDRIVATDRYRAVAAAIAHSDSCLVPACVPVPGSDEPWVGTVGRR